MIYRGWKKIAIAQAYDTVEKSFKTIKIFWLEMENVEQSTLKPIGC